MFTDPFPVLGYATPVTGESVLWESLPRKPSIPFFSLCRSLGLRMSIRSVAEASRLGRGALRPPLPALQGSSSARAGRPCRPTSLLPGSPPGQNVSQGPGVRTDAVSCCSSSLRRGFSSTCLSWAWGESPAGGHAQGQPFKYSLAVWPDLGCSLLALFSGRPDDLERVQSRVTGMVLDLKFKLCG